MVLETELSREYILHDPSSLSLPWRGIRYIEGTRMVEIDVYWFYWASMALYQLHTLPPDRLPLSAVSGHLGMARVALETFGDDRARVFPKTAGAIRDILACINEIMPEQDASIPMGARIVMPSQVVALRKNLTALTVFLKDEASHNYVLCVENQRFLSSYSLVEKIDSCFAPGSWDVIDDTAKREFEESGKCLAVERYTGAGFHALRGVECVIRQYIVKLTGSLPKKRDWGSYIEVLMQNNADSSLTVVLDNIRTLDRNPLMHPEHCLDIDEAIAIFNISQTAIVRLVAGIKKMKTKTEYDKFTDLVDGVLKVPHKEIKAKLNAEKKPKKRKPKRTSASGHV